jgi:DNA modification methylase
MQKYSLIDSERYALINGDCCEEIKKLESDSIHFSVFSPPFAELYVYSDDYRDMGNSRTYEEFFEHFSFLTPELCRVMMPGRLVAVHCQFLPILKGKEGYLGFRNFPAGLQESFEKNGFVLNGPPITIWKDPVVEMQRTKAIGLLNKQKDKDATISRTGNPDFIYVFRKLGENPIPVTHSTTDSTRPNYLPVDYWQKIASPVWYDINYSDTLNNYRAGRHEQDEKHICPLQLPTIKRLVELYTNPDEIILSPFAGIGSEGYQALKMNRRFIGIELKESYFNIARKNLKNATVLNSQLSLI